MKTTLLIFSLVLTFNVFAETETDCSKISQSRDNEKVIKEESSNETSGEGVNNG